MKRNIIIAFDLILVILIALFIVSRAQNRNKVIEALPVNYEENKEVSKEESTKIKEITRRTRF